MEKEDKKINIRFKQLEDNPELSIVFLEGYVDSYNAKYFQENIENYIKNNNKNIIFDCTALSYLSSAGIGSFVAIAEDIKDNGVLVLYGINPKVMEVFNLLGFTKFFNICNHYEDAVEKAKTLMGKKGEEAILEGIEEKIIFPFVFECRVCGKKLKATKPGSFSCPLCRSKIEIDKDGNIAFG